MWLLLLIINPFLLVLPLYYWITFDEMKSQHRVRRIIWLVLVPLCLITIVVSFGLSLLPMMFFIALGEAFDKPKPYKKTEFDVKLEKFVTKNVWTKLLWLTITLLLLLWLLLLLTNFLRIFL